MLKILGIFALMWLAAFAPMAVYAWRRADVFYPAVFFIQNKRRLIIGTVLIVVVTSLFYFKPSWIQTIEYFAMPVLFGMAIGQMVVTLLKSD